VTGRNLIRRALLEPHFVAALSAPEWDLLVRQGRRANLLGRLACTLSDQGLLDHIPQAPRRHLASAMRLGERQAIAVRWEIACIGRAFAEKALPVLLLKGAAYLAADLAASRGRVFADVDLMVPFDSLDDAESALMQHGWRGDDSSAYDQRYYRVWMHEIPPMTHVRRGTTIDLHHNIVPRSGSLHLDGALLFRDRIMARDRPRVDVLMPCDMLLHSATHLFQEGELESGLRDLFDLDSLLREFGEQPGFWEALPARAHVLGLMRPLYFALRYTTLLLGTPVPAGVLAAADNGAPMIGTGWLADFCYRRALEPGHASCDRPGSGIARTLIYLRGHWIRMPLHRLTLHLARKAWLRWNPIQPTRAAPP
jgi:Uncharacterised nucleotidyltransferase